MRVEFPLRTGRGQNDREHWRARAVRVHAEKLITFVELRVWSKPPTPCTVNLTRIAPSNGLDDDNLAGSLKAVRDAFADWIGIDDKRRDIVRYEYRQERGPWGVRIEAQPRT